MAKGQLQRARHAVGEHMGSTDAAMLVESGTHLCFATPFLSCMPAMLPSAAHLAPAILGASRRATAAVRHRHRRLPSLAAG